MSLTWEKFCQLNTSSRVGYRWRRRLRSKGFKDPYFKKLSKYKFQFTTITT